MNDSTLYPFKKLNQDPLYINTGSNPPKKVYNFIMTRLWSNSSNINIFIKKKSDYEKSLTNSRDKARLTSNVDNKKLILARKKEENRYGLGHS